MLDVMPEFLVTPEHVIAASARLTAIGQEVDELYSHLSGCASAAAGTPTEGAFDDLLGHFSSVLPHFGLAGEHLGAAVAGAGRSYSSCDDEVAGACQAGQGGG
jgi:hypothetical protein